LTEGLRLTEDCFMLSVDTDSNEKRTETAGQKLRVCFLSCCEEILREKGSI
jgi:hypothetical protein